MSPVRKLICVRTRRNWRSTLIRMQIIFRTGVLVSEGPAFGKYALSEQFTQGGGGFCVGNKLAYEVGAMTKSVLLRWAKYLENHSKLMTHHKNVKSVREPFFWYKLIPHSLS